MIYLRNTTAFRQTFFIAGVMYTLAPGSSITTDDVNLPEVDKLVSGLPGLIKSNPTVAFQVNYGAPSAKDAQGDNIVSTVTDLSATVSTALTIAAQPITPRNLLVALSDAAGSDLAGSITVVGTNAAGVSQTETFTVVAGTGSYTGAKAFATITSIHYNFGTTGAAADTLKIGDGDILGLPIVGTNFVPTKIIENGADVTVASARYDSVNNTYKPATAPDGTKLFQIWGTYTL